jgi:urease accessory protein
MHRTALRIAAVLLALVPTVAFAHPGHDGPGLVAGFLHPLGGVDHIIAMVAVGLLAARLGGRALWLVPASFVGTMAVAGLAAMAGLGLPFVETGIALSVVVLAAVAILGVAMPVAAAMGLVAFFAVFHGYAHGAEMPETASGFAYGAGFVAATALLHGVGIGIGLTIMIRSRDVINCCYFVMNGQHFDRNTDSQGTSGRPGRSRRSLSGWYKGTLHSGTV